MRRVVVLVLFVVCGAVAGRSHAAEPSSAEAARALFREGREAMKRGEYRAALERLLESNQLDRQLGTLLNLALCEERLGLLRSASEHFAEVTRLAAAGDVRGGFAEARRRAIDERLPHVTLDVQVEPGSGAELALDGVSVAAERWAMPLSLDPGRHELSLSAPGRRPLKLGFLLEESQRLELALKLDRAQIRALETPPASGATHTRRGTSSDPRPSAPVDRGSLPGRSAHRDAALVAASIGATGLLTSAVAALFVLHEKSVVDEHCKTGLCDASGAEAQSQGRTWSVIGSVSFAVGIAGLGTGTYLWFSRPTRSSASAAGADSSTTGAMAGLRGSF